MRHLISAAAAAVAVCFVATTVHAAPITTASSVTYELFNYDFTATPTGPTTLNLTAGQAFHIEGSWQSVFDAASNNNNACPDCAEQLYLAGLPGLDLQINVHNDFFDPAGVGSGGTYAANLTAPLVAGIYYIGGAYTLDYGFLTGVAGATNTNAQVSYILNVSPAAVPEPASLILFGTGLCGLAASRRRARK